MAKKTKDSEKQITTGLALLVAGLSVLLVVSLGRTRTVYVNRSVTATTSNKALIKSTSAYTQSYVGLTEQEAMAKAKADGLIGRVVSDESREPIAITDDLRNDRLNFTIRNGRIVKVELF